MRPQMDLRDEVKSRLTKPTSLPRNTYDAGDVAGLGQNILKCSGLARQLAKLVPPERGKEFTHQAKKFHGYGRRP